MREQRWLYEFQKLMAKLLYFLCTGVAEDFQFRTVERHEAKIQTWKQGRERQARDDYDDAQPERPTLERVYLKDKNKVQASTL